MVHYHEEARGVKICYLRCANDGVVCEASAPAPLLVGCDHACTCLLNDINAPIQTLEWDIRNLIISLRATQGLHKIEINTRYLKVVEQPESLITCEREIVRKSLYLFLLPFFSNRGWKVISRYNLIPLTRSPVTKKGNGDG